MKTQIQPLEYSHFPVMLSEIIQIIIPSKGGLFVDCTFGGGGYSKAILKFPKTKLISIDRDSTVMPAAKKLEKKFQDRFKFYQLKFSELKSITKDKADAIIFDLGLSSIQLNNLKRGFSFKSKEKLDMRMGLSDFSLKDAINNLSQEQLKLIIKILGEENEASIISKNIIKARSEKKITRVDELVKIIEKSKRKNLSKKINPSTKTFQALRIFVNKEISELIYGLINSYKILPIGGIIAVVTFHSLEDKIVKFFFKNYSEIKNKSRYLPNVKDQKILFKLKSKKPIYPSEKEVQMNAPSRSAKLRYGIKLSHNSDFDDFIKKFQYLIDIENMSEKLWKK